MLCWPTRLGTSASWPIPSSPWHGAHTAATAGAPDDCATASRGYTIAQIAMLQFRKAHLETEVIGSVGYLVYEQRRALDFGRHRLTTRSRRVEARPSAPADVFTARSHRSRHKGDEVLVPQCRSSPKWRGSRSLLRAFRRKPPELIVATFSAPRWQTMCLVDMPLALRALFTWLPKSFAISSLSSPLTYWLPTLTCTQSASADHTRQCVGCTSTARPVIAFIQRPSSLRRQGNSSAWKTS